MGKIQDIIDILTQELNDGKYPPNSRFPSEYELSIRFGVGRITANKAVSALAAAGRLVRGSRGSGTRVSSGSLRSKGRIVFLGSIVQPNEVKTLRGTLRAAQNCGYTLEVANPIDIVVVATVAVDLVNLKFINQRTVGIHNLNMQVLKYFVGKAILHVAIDSNAVLLGLSKSASTHKERQI